MAAEGYLLCNVYTSDAQIPVLDALITITQNTPGDIPALLALRLTDSSGRTAPVAIETPARSSTTAPGTANGWTSVDITVEHPGFQRIIVKDAQIFAQTRTLQTFALIPLPSNAAHWDTPEVFQTPPQNL